MDINFVQQCLQTGYSDSGISDRVITNDNKTGR